MGDGSSQSPGGSQFLGLAEGLLAALAVTGVEHDDAYPAHLLRSGRAGWALASQVQGRLSFSRGPVWLFNFGLVNSRLRTGSSCLKTRRTVSSSSCATGWGSNSSRVRP